MMMLETVGQMLQAARSQRKLSLEDASRATKIRTRQLADLERDEYSNFPNLAYAKGFLISYGKYLEVDVRPYLEAFEDANSFGLDNYQYLSEVPLGVYRSTRRPTRRRSDGKSRTLTALAIGLVVFATVCWRLYVNYERLGPLDKLAEHQDERERGSDSASSAADKNLAKVVAAVAAEHAATLASVQPAQSAAANVSAPAAAPGGGARPASAATVTSSVPAATPVPRYDFRAVTGNRAVTPALPLSGDGTAIRQMLTAVNTLQPPLLVYLEPSGAGNGGNSSSSRSAAAAAPADGMEHGSWSPENVDGYRFYVRTFDRSSAEIFRTGVPRPQTVLNSRY